MNHRCDSPTGTSVSTLHPLDQREYDENAGGMPRITAVDGSGPNVVPLDRTTRPRRANILDE